MADASLLGILEINKGVDRWDRPSYREEMSVGQAYPPAETLRPTGVGLAMMRGEWGS
jgi:hypothetical protein